MTKIYISSTYSDLVEHCQQLSCGKDMVLVPVEVLVCNNCGKRYYDRRTMQRLEEIEDAVHAGRLSLERVGEVLLVRRELVSA